MRRIFLLSVICAMAVTAVLASPSFVKAEEDTYQIPVNEDGVEAVTIELKSGTKAVVFILRETPDTLYVENLNDSMDVSVPRSNVVKMRKPSAREVEKTKKRLGISAPTAPVSK